ncbi:MAG TPA: hypothetical protein VF624_17670 [Tepidisphaeraceae bacterium]|jgi:Na+/proline symporter
MQSFLAQTSIPSNVTWVDWLIIVVVFLVVTLLGGWLAGRQQTFRDFFLAGRRLPWWAVAASIASAQLTAGSFIALPAAVFPPAANMVYLQLPLIGALLARGIVAWWAVPKLFAKEYFSPYDLMADRLGAGVRPMATVLFVFQTVLGQACRLYLTAFVVEVMFNDQLRAFESATGIPPIAAAIVGLGLFMTLWTVIGGIRTAVWTDVALFVVLTAGIVVSLIAVAWKIPGGFTEIFQTAYATNKLKAYDFSLDPTRAYTLWSCLIGGTLLGFEQNAASGSITQRLLCCRNPREARLALMTSWLGIVVPVCGLLLGAALYVFYQQHALPPAAAALLAQRRDNIFPIFLLRELPTGVIGIIVAGLLAASIDAVLPALAQATMSAFYLPRIKERFVGSDESERSRIERRNVTIGRWLVVGFGLLIAVLALAAERLANYLQTTTAIDFVTSMSTYGGGAVVGGLLLALLPTHRVPGIGRGFLFAAPLSVLIVYALAWHGPVALWVCVVGVAILMVVWLGTALYDSALSTRLDEAAYLLVGSALVLLAWQYAYWLPAKPNLPPPVLAFTWYTAIGTMATMAWAVLLAGRTRIAEESDRVAAAVWAAQPE